MVVLVSWHDGIAILGACTIVCEIECIIQVATAIFVCTTATLYYVGAVWFSFFL